MKSDLDALMQAYDIDAILITGPAQHNPGMVYMTGGGHMTGGDYLKKRGQEPVLYYNPMERDEAARSGLPTRDLSSFHYNDLLQQTGGDQARAMALRYQQMLTEQGITSGRVVLYGLVEAGNAFTIFSELQKANPGLKVTGEINGPVLLEAMQTKDQAEIERIRRMGKITTEVVGMVADFLSEQPAHNDILEKPNGEPLTIGDIKSHINLWLAERGAENPEGTIFSIGRDAGVPHSSGTSRDALRLGQTIVFDIFPCEAGGGYYYDFTRTWCLGYAPDEAQALYEDVLAAYRKAMSALKPGTLGSEYQQMICELFEQQGHATIQSNPNTREGYVHSLGHGVGLHIHEWPRLSKSSADKLASGMVFTIEPGLYYPDRGLGVRLEDTVWLRPDGKFEILADYPLDLILPVRRRV